MVRWPGTIKQAVSDFQWAFWDFMPTAAELSGGTAPTGIDGVSIVPTLLGEKQEAKPYLFFTWPGDKPIPSPPSPPPGPPVPVSSVQDQWCQDYNDSSSSKCDIPINITVSASGRVAVVACPAQQGGCKQLKWKQAAGTIKQGSPTTLRVVATGEGGFKTGEIGEVQQNGGKMQIEWKPSGGAKKHWSNWRKVGEISGDNRLTAPVPDGWQAVQTGEGLLEYYNLESGVQTAIHPDGTSGGKGPSGYAINVGEWKGTPP